ncbi:hypothetical protein GCM10027081_16350 [Cupriavidus yeoncheonensis]
MSFLPARNSRPTLLRLVSAPALSHVIADLAMNDGELAQLAKYLRATYGGQPADVKADAVKALRVARPGH